MSNEQLSRKRVAASQAIHAALLGAVFLAVKYGSSVHLIHQRNCCYVCGRKRTECGDPASQEGIG